MRHRTKEQEVANLQAILNNLLNLSGRLEQEQSHICDRLRKLMGRERFKEWIERKIEKDCIEAELMDQGRG